jgi:hypothetical protein
MKRDKLPSQIAVDKAKRAQTIEEERNLSDAKFKSALINTFKTEHGKIVLRWLMNECGFGKPILGATAGQIDEKATLYQAMRLNLYLSIRKKLPLTILNEVEND